MINIVREDGKIKIDCPFDWKFNRNIKMLGGRFERPYWVVQEKHEERARAILREIYLHDGTPEPTCTMHVDLDKAGVDGDTFRVGPIVALRKAFRDVMPQVGPDCAVIVGNLKSSGGSARYPEITYTPGTVLEVGNVPVSVAAVLTDQKPDAYTVDAYTVIETVEDDGERFVNVALPVKAVKALRAAIATIEETMDNDAPDADHVDIIRRALDSALAG